MIISNHKVSENCYNKNYNMNVVKN